MQDDAIDAYTDEDDDESDTNSFMEVMLSPLGGMCSYSYMHTCIGMLHPWLIFCSNGVRDRPLW